jgi:hypothetical protein
MSKNESQKYKNTTKSCEKSKVKTSIVNSQKGKKARRQKVKVN